MSGWAAKRFWKEAKATECDGGFTVLLDGRSVRTPAKASLVLPTMAMAEAIAEEWAAQEKSIQPLTMPVTRSANAAIDKVQHQFAEVADMVADYGDADLLCYRANSPVELAERQARAWDPLLDWGGAALGARLEPREGVLHTAQDAEALAVLRKRVHEMSAFELAAFHDLVGLSGSLIIGFAAIAEVQEPDALWQISRIDEAWQIEQWGEDDEATEIASKKLSEFLHAFRFFKLSR